MYIREKLAKEIVSECVTVGTLKEYQKLTGKDMEETITDMETKFEEMLSHRIDYHDGWLSFLMEYKEATEDEMEKLLEAGAQGYEEGYKNGWQDRDTISREIRKIKSPTCEATQAGRATVTKMEETKAQ